MFRKAILAGVASALFSTSVLAGGAIGMPTPDLSGLYAGFDLGYLIYDHRMSTNFIDTGSGDQAGLNTHIFGDGIRGGFFLGYGMLFDDEAYLGLQARGSLTKSRSELTATALPAGQAQQSTEVVTGQLSGNYSFSVRPGYLVTDDTMIYFDAGYARGKFHSNHSETDNSTAPATQSNTSDLHWSNGIEFGAGIETKLTDVVSLRAEFLQTRYHGWEWTVASVGGPSRDQEKPITNEVNIGLVWNIGDPVNLGDMLTS